MALFIDLKVGESVNIDNNRVTLTLREKSGQRARLEFNADRGVRIVKQKPSVHPAAKGLTGRQESAV